MFRILLAIGNSELRRMLRDAIARCPDMEIVAEADTPVSLLVEVGRSRADVAILSAADEAELPAVCTHLFAEYPGVLVLVVSPDGRRACVWRERIEREDLPDFNPDDMRSVLQRPGLGYFVATK